VLKKAAELHAKALEEKQLSVAKGALDIIGKHVDVQAFREQIQHSGLIEYKNLSDEEIAARIAAHEAARADRPTTH
jgi:DNA-binding protein H-NS